MLLEIATIKIKAGTNQAFEEAVTGAIPLFKTAQGCHTMNLRRCLEEPETYLLFVEWETLEDHTEHFRGSDSFQKWRSLIGEYLAETPHAVHYNIVVDGF